MTDSSKPATCGARLREQPGKFCEKQPMLGKTRCALHGGKSTGARTPDGKARQATNGLKHGVYMNTMADCYESMGVPKDVFYAVPETTDLSPELRLARNQVVKYAKLMADGKTHIVIGISSLSLDVLYNQALLTVRAMAKTQQEIKPGGDIGGHLTFNINVSGEALAADNDEVPNLTDDAPEAEEVPSSAQPATAPKRAGNGYDDDE